MQVSLDINIWIFGILGVDGFCEKILLNIEKFDVIIPDQVRAELERNLSDYDMKQFYQFVLRFDVKIDFAKVPSSYISRSQTLFGNAFFDALRRVPKRV
ncbi:hypothetical protein QUF54_02315 [Candidatus Marithioploca araucensis]|uniref:PIN domain-containing protein n=1 Tax=Candidatus Marithioploca araucensis TaxID=70273 RepID=A0ABT7VR86_9GAMM|nr:hypothetical protein [Candidatus Marithioploca araucensis]